MKLLIIRKLSAALLIAFGICYVVGVYTAAYQFKPESYLSNVILTEHSWIDGYTLLSYLFFAGFSALWLILGIRGKMNTRFIAGLMVLNVVCFIWFSFMDSSNATLKGFVTAIWTNMFMTGINSFFSLGYIISPHD